MSEYGHERAVIKLAQKDQQAMDWMQRAIVAEQKLTATEGKLRKAERERDNCMNNYKLLRMAAEAAEGKLAVAEAAIENGYEERQGIKASLAEYVEAFKLEAADNIALKNQLAEAVRALEEYGEHSIQCIDANQHADSNGEYPGCTCGFTAALQSLNDSDKQADVSDTPGRARKRA